MKQILAPAGLLVLLAAAWLPDAAPATTPTDDRVWFSGSSNLRSFTCRSRSVGTAVLLQDDARIDEVMAKDDVVADLALHIPADSFHCGIAMMNRHLRHTLHADEHPLIRFRLRGYDLVPGEDPPAATVEGTLYLAGVERPVQVEGRLEADAAGMIRFRGSHPLRPSEFGIRPPRRFAGLLRVRDQVTVHYDIGVTPSSVQPF